MDILALAHRECKPSERGYGAANCTSPDSGTSSIQLLPGRQAHDRAGVVDEPDRVGTRSLRPGRVHRRPAGRHPGLARADQLGLRDAAVVADRDPHDDHVRRAQLAARAYPGRPRPPGSAGTARMPDPASRRGSRERRIAGRSPRSATPPARPSTPRHPGRTRTAAPAPRGRRASRSAPAPARARCAARSWCWCGTSRPRCRPARGSRCRRWCPSSPGRIGSCPPE